MQTRSALLLLVALAATALPASAQWLHTFDSEAALKRDFTFITTAANPLQYFSHVRSGEGLLRSGTLSAPENGGGMSAQIHHGQGFSPLTPAWRCSIYFRYAAPHAAARIGPFFGIGAVRSFIPVEGELFNLTTTRAQTADDAFVGLRALLVAPAAPAENPGVLQIAFQSFNIPGVPKSAPFTSPPTSAADNNLLVPGRWYFLQLDVSRGDQGYDYEVALRESDHEGRVGRGLLSVSGRDVTNQAFADAPQAHPFVALHSSSLAENFGLSAVDNFACSALPPAE
jgi:hypothetical protein